MGKGLLQHIHSPKDLKKLDLRELELLCEEIRRFLIEKVSKTGGHLSSNLGMVELSVALHYNLNSPQDVLVFDVGHQCYTHKLLTGRQEGFDKLRSRCGLSGFPCPGESEHDPFVVGHSSTSISSAAGIARAKKLKGEDGLVVAIIGDGAFTGGMAYEGLNNVAGLDNLVIILNDNKMSISKNNGALAQYFSRLRNTPQYYKAKAEVKSVLESTPFLGGSVTRGIQSVKSAIRRGLYHSTFFEELGLNYVGPVDGHNLEELHALFSNIRQIRKPLLLYVESTKGKGFSPAEKNPGAFHGVPAFNLDKIVDPDVSSTDSYSLVFGQTLARLADNDKRICGITAAMKYGTGLQYLKKSFPQRFFDVGIAEGHAVTFAAGLAKGGMLPVVSIYSTFLQRAYDQIIHDVVLQNANVLFAVDRAGLVPCDGETHQGIYDAAYFSQHGSLPVISPANYAELVYWLERLVKDYSGPRAIRYPKGKEPEALRGLACTGMLYDRLMEGQGKKLALVSYGTLAAQALCAGQALQQEGLLAGVYKMVQINPIDQGLVKELLPYENVLFAEDGIRSGGIGEHLLARLCEAGFKGKYVHLAVTENKADHAEIAQLQEDFGLNSAAIAERCRELCT